jgi:hypothetical protein
MKLARVLLDRHLAASFVGRSEELSLLREILADDGLVVAHLHGVAGMGKSRRPGAFTECARATRNRDALTVAGFNQLGACVIVTVTACALWFKVRPIDGWNP